jgi:hypothetical protein
MIRIWYHSNMLEAHQPSSEIHEATPAPLAPHEPAAPLNTAPASSAVSDASAAPPKPIAALANDLKYTLTIGQARELFALNRRKVPSERTLQDYCQNGRIAGKKISTSFGREYLINEKSLIDHIEREPILTMAPHAPHEPAAPLNTAPASSAVSDASAAPPAPISSRPVTIGETRTLADVLIENAKLVATIEGKDHVIHGKDETIAELKDDRTFLREEVREGRQQRKDVKDIANRMLEAMETIATNNRNLPQKNSHDDVITARVIDPRDPPSQQP